MRELKFGVEIEFFGANYITIIEQLRANGIQVADFSGYTHTVIPQWKITTDCSVNSRGTGLGKGLELVSPILYGDEGLDELEKVYTVLNECGAKVDRSCGTHVHFDIADYTVEDMVSFLNLYYKEHTLIDHLVPASRRDNRYCQQLRTADIKRINERFEDDRIQGIRDIRGILYSRYRTVNLDSYVKYGTIEFRQHGGTTEFEKMEAWIILMYQMLAAAKGSHIRAGRAVRATVDNFKGFMEIVNLKDTYTEEFLTNRFKHFTEVA